MAHPILYDNIELDAGSAHSKTPNFCLLFHLHLVAMARTSRVVLFLQKETLSGALRMQVLVQTCRM